MIIGIDARMYGLEHAGIGRYVESLVTELANKRSEDKLVLFLRRKQFHDLKFGSNVKMVLADFGHYTLAEQIKFPSLINKYPIDLMHFPHFNVPILYGRPYVVTIHDLLWHKVRGLEVTTLSPWTYSFKYMGYRLVSSLAIARSRLVIVPSSWVKHEVLENMMINRDKIHVVYEGIDQDYLKGKPGVSYQSLQKKLGLVEPYLVYTGNAYPHKNLRRLVEAVVLINSRQKQKVQLVIVSSRSAFLDQLNRYIQEKGASKYFVIAGYLTDREIVRLYKHALALVHPSTSEGFGLTGLEAMAVGTPVVASRAGSLPEIYKDSALYFDPYSVPDMAEEITLLLSNDQLRSQYIEKGKKLVSLYSWSDMASETWRLYKKALGK